MAEKKEQGLSTKEKGVYIPPEHRAPHRPEYLNMSKADVVAAEKKRRADDAKVKKYKEELKADKPAVAEKEEPKSESAIVEKAKKKGRPKKNQE